MSSSDVGLSDAVGDMARFFMLAAILDMVCMGGVRIFVECLLSLDCVRGAWMAHRCVCMHVNGGQIYHHRSSM